MMLAFAAKEGETHNDIIGLITTAKHSAKSKDAYLLRLLVFRYTLSPSIVPFTLERAGRSALDSADVTIADFDISSCGIK